MFKCLLGKGQAICIVAGKKGGGVGGQMDGGTKQCSGAEEQLWIALPRTFSGVGLPLTKNGTQSLESPFILPEK